MVKVKKYVRGIQRPTKRSARLAILYQILNDDFMLDVENWCDSDLQKIRSLITEIVKVRGD